MARRSTTPRLPANVAVIVSCEHGGNGVPAPYRHLFVRQGALLASHRGYDPGALVMAQELARAFDAPLFSATVSRLVVDLNRSAGHQGVFSKLTRDLPEADKKALLARYHTPHRAAVEAAIAAAVARQQRVVHVCAHSFTPVLAGVRRRADVGFLYDPARPHERALGRAWQAQLREMAPALRVRLNYPYRGTSDGLTTWLRRRFADSAYAGIELEMNQRHVRAGGASWQALRRDLVAALAEILAKR